MPLGLEDQSANLRATVERYEPADMREYQHEIAAALPAVVENVAAMVRTAQAKAIGELPVHPAYAQAFGSVVGLLASAAEAAIDLPRAYAAMHEGELNRYEHPRPSEKLWDVAG